MILRPDRSTLAERQRAAASILLLLAGALCQAQPAPAPSPLSSQVATAPLFSGTYVNTTVNAQDQNAVITAQPQGQVSTQQAGAATGLLKLGISSTSRDGYLFVPYNYHVQRAQPMIVTLHAAGHNGLDGLAPLLSFAQQQGVFLLAPDSRLATWDYLNTSTFGPDVAFINASMAAVFSRYNVQQGQVGIEGFSDGATYALILGITNGRIFTTVMGFSPGGVLSPQPTGKPSVFLSAGDEDDTYGEPANRVAANIACQLQAQGYSVDFTEFAGGHEVPAAVAGEAGAWFLNPTPNPANASVGCNSG